MKNLGSNTRGTDKLKLNQKCDDQVLLYTKLTCLNHVNMIFQRDCSRDTVHVFTSIEQSLNSLQL